MHQVEKLPLAYKGFVTVIDFVNTAAQEYFWILNVPYISGVCVCIGCSWVTVDIEATNSGLTTFRLLSKASSSKSEKIAREIHYVGG